MILRYGTSILLGGLAAFVVLSVMQELVTREPPEIKDVRGMRIVDFVRLKRESEPEVKKRELPDRAQPERPPPPPEMEMAKGEAPNALEIAASMPAFEPEMDLAGRPGGGAAAGPSDADVVPLVRVSPQYPARALQRGVEGWVQLRFTITEAGTVKDVAIVKAEPSSYFEEAATSAVRKYKYKPKIVDGKAVERPGVEIILSFRLQT
jgi:periplasmic protein TonB